MKKRLNLNKLNINSMKGSGNKGFTLVELIVVLVLTAILLSITIFGGLAWQDWMQFKHENSVAEEIFFAAQNQLIEIDSSGATEREVIRPLQVGATGTEKFNSSFILASSRYDKVTKNTFIYDTLLKQIKIDKGSYDWNTIWAETNAAAEAMGLNKNKVVEDKTIIKLVAKPGDYSKYEDYLTASDKSSVDISMDAVLLFDLVSTYISDTSVLNGAITLEFSPEVGQVLSVCYSDRVSELYYQSPENTGAVSVMSRIIQDREDNMVGYYSVDQLTEKIRGKGMEKADAIFEIQNAETLQLIVFDTKNELNDEYTLKFNLFDGDEGSSSSGKVMDFSVPYVDIPKKNSSDSPLQYASEHPVTCKIKISQGKYTSIAEGVDFRLPMWRDEDGNIHIILDAADVQAGTSVYKDAKGNKDLSENSPASKFNNTYSFYRFGVEKYVNYLYGTVSFIKEGTESVAIDSSHFDENGRSTSNLTGYQLHKDSLNENGSCGECTTFNAYNLKAESEGGEQKRYLDIANARHLYNMRYETEYKELSDKKNVFTLVDNINWSEFKNLSNSGDGNNYFLNSYEINGVVSGINYNGKNPATGGNTTQFDIETVKFPFPGFRCLGKGDTFTQSIKFVDPEEEEGKTSSASGVNNSSDGDDSSSNGKDGESEENYVISNLNISFAANVVYGIYDDVFEYDIKDSNESTDLYKKDISVKTACLGGDFSGLLGLQYETSATINAHKDSSRSKLAMGGAMPLGLFAENLGTISNITLDHHVVSGLEKIDGNENLVYTCMVGGFVGNNLGTISSLTLLSSKSNKAEDLTTHINGRKDVGGILGRQSFVLSGASSDVEIEDMRNYGNVTGVENVGGIVGRVYTNYVGDTNSANTHKPTYYIGDENSAVLTDEKDVSTYMNYHDGYFISDNNKSMTGQTVQRATKVTVKKSKNRGIVSGDYLLSEGMIEKIEMNFAKSLVETYTKNVANSKCAFIGGIAGVTMDGLMYNNNNIRMKSTSSTDKPYPNMVNFYSKFFNREFANVNIEDCDSYTVYSTSEIEALKADDKVFNRDIFVGGIVGYTRLTALKGCDIEPKKSMMENEVPMTYVFGYRYVGGIAGCSDMSRYDYGENRNDTSDRKYRAVNYNNVIGKMYIGGVAGCFGIGDVRQESFSFRDPAANEASAPSQIYGDNKIEAVDTIKNTGIAMSFKSGMAMKVDPDNVESTGAVGGVAGATRHSIFNSDSIQSEKVKSYMLKLINNNTDVSADSITPEMLIEITEASKYGGNYVGGIVGYLMPSGMVNPKDSSYSVVDSVVYGQDMVGGGIGYTSDNESDSNMYNLLPGKEDDSSGLYVFGTDVVGGMSGQTAKELFYRGSTSEITNPYKVVGRYFVGGITGRVRRGNNTADLRGVKIDNELTDKISINGIAYVGGLAGTVDYSIKDWKCLDADLKNMDINGKYFTAGVVGVYNAINDTNNNDFGPFTDVGFTGRVNYKIIADSSVKATGEIFTGGLIGLYTAHYYNDLETVDGTTKKSTLIKLIDDNLKTGTNTFADYSTAFNKLDKANVFDSGTKTITAGEGSTITNNVTVESKIYAGGMFGYIPDGHAVTVKNFTNNGNIHTTEAVKVNGVDYSFLGGVIGRVPNSVTLDNCKNVATGKYTSGNSSDPESYYYSEKADYLGGLAEVNSGVIQNCENKTSYIYDDFKGGIGAIAGVNGNANTNGSLYGVIKNCKNTAEIRAKYAAGIAAAAGGESKITESQNTGNIKAVGEDTKCGAAGIMYSVLDSVNQDVVIDKCVNSGTIRAAASYTNSDNNDTGIESENRAGIIYDSNGRGVLTTCRNYAAGLINGITSNKDGEKAKSIHYCFDASQAPNHIGDVNPVEPTEDMYMNFYIGRTTSSGKEEPNPDDMTEDDHFEAQQFYAYNLTRTTYLTGGSNEFVDSYDTRGTETDISNLVMGNDIDFENKYKHNTESRWDINSSDGGRAGFVIRPVHEDGSYAYADIKTFAIAWDNYKRTEYSAFYQFSDKKDSDFSSQYNDYNTQKIDFNTGEKYSYYSLAKDDYDGNVLFSDLPNYNGYLSGQTQSEDGLERLAFATYCDMVLNHSDDINEKSDSFIIRYYMQLLYKYAADYPSWNPVWNGEDGIAAYYKKKDSVYSEQYAIFKNNKYDKVLSLTAKKLAEDEYNYETYKDTTKYSSINLKGTFWHDDSYFDNYAFNCYCTLLNDLNNKTYTATEFKEKLIDYIYKYVEKFSKSNVQAWQTTMKYSYEIKITDRYDRVCVAARAKADGGENEVKIATYVVGTFVNTADAYQVQEGFNSKEIKKIEIIMNLSEGNQDNTVGIRAFRWSSSKGGSDEATMEPIVPKDAQNIYEDAENLNDVISIIKNNKPKTTFFVPVPGSNFTLSLVKDSAPFYTNITGITYDPLGTEANDYKYDYKKAYMESIRKQMFTDMDEKYLQFIEQYK